MFVLGKRSRLITSLAFFLPGNEFANLAMAVLWGSGIYSLAAFGFLCRSVPAGCMALLLFACIDL